MTALTLYSPLIDMILTSCRAATTRTRYARKLRLYLDWWEQAGKPALSRPVVQAYMSTISTQAAFQQLHSLTAIKKLAKEAFYRGLMSQGDYIGIDELSAPRVLGIRQGVRLTEDEIIEVLTKPDGTLKGLRDRVAIELLFYAGLRRSEAASITKDQIQRIDGRPVIANLIGKGGRVRSVPIPAFVVEHIDAWMQAAGITDGVVLRAINRWGKVSAEGIHDSSLALISEQYGGICCHDFRRTMACLARKRGVALDQIQQILGHADIKTTQIYIGGNVDFENAVCDALPVITGQNTLTKP